MATIFPYHNPHTLVFQQDYAELVTFPVPFFLIKDDLLQTMQSFGHSRFKVPAKYTQLHKDLWFVFTVERKQYEKFTDDWYLYQGVMLNNLAVVRVYQLKRSQTRHETDDYFV